jgi:hypothetical protein
MSAVATVGGTRARRQRIRELVWEGRDVLLVCCSR